MIRHGMFTSTRACDSTLLTRVRFKGCCHSTTTDEGSSSPAARSSPPTSNLPHDSSRAAINQPSRSLSNVNSPRASSLSHTQPPPSRPNAPIRPPSPVPRCPTDIGSGPTPWTRAQLEKEREAFFETRVTGSEEVWSALRLACEELRKGGEGLEEAQGILDAAGLSCPKGRVVAGRSSRDRVKGGVYDERGVLYEIPAWVVADPEDVVESRDAGGEKDKVEGAAGVQTDQDEKDKGKGRAADAGEMLSLRARLSDRSTDVTVRVGSKEKIAVAVRKIQEQIGNKRVRLAYLGHVLQEGKTLEEQGFKTGNVVNAYVFEGDEKMLRK